MTFSYDSHVSNGHAALAAKDYRRAVECFLAAVDETKVYGAADARWVYSRCALAKASYRAYSPTEWPASLAQFGNVTGILADAWWPFKGPQELAFFEVGRTFMELAEFASVSLEPVDHDAAYNFYLKAREMSGRVNGADIQLAHAMYQCASYRAHPGILEMLQNAHELLQRHAKAATPVVANGENLTYADRIERKWADLTDCVARVHGQSSAEVVSSLLAAIRHLGKYERMRAAESNARRALGILEQNLRLDPERRRISFLENFLRRL